MVEEEKSRSENAPVRFESKSTLPDPANSHIGVMSLICVVGLMSLMQLLSEAKKSLTL